MAPKESRGQPSKRPYMHIDVKRKTPCLLLVARLHLDLLVVATIRRIPGTQSVRTSASSAAACLQACPGETILQELLNQIDVGHDHAAAAVPLASQLVQRITAHPHSHQYHESRAIRPASALTHR